MTRPATALFTLLAAAFIASPARAREWDRFRGPDGAGHADASTTLPAQWTDKDYEWKIDLPGVGHSSPVVWGERVFVTGADEDATKRILLCVRATDGQTLWQREWPSHSFKKHNFNSFASCTPAADAERVYVLWSTPEHFNVLALDHDGKDVWTRDLGPYKAEHGGGASPIVYEDLLIVPNDQDGPSSIVALDKKTGEVRWKTPRKATRFSAATPAVYRPGGGDPPQLVFTSLSHGMTGIDPKDGHVIWEVPDAFSLRTVSSPVVGPGLVYGSCGEGPKGKNLIAVRPGADGKKAEVAFNVTQDAPYVPTSLVKGALLFAWSDGGVVTCLNAATGQVVWRQRVPGDYFSSPVLAGDHLYNISKSGDVICLAAGEKFEKLGQTKLGELCHTTPALSHGRMIIRTYGHLFCVAGHKPAA